MISFMTYQPTIIFTTQRHSRRANYILKVNKLICKKQLRLIQDSGGANNYRHVRKQKTASFQRIYDNFSIMLPHIDLSQDLSQLTQRREQEVYRRDTKVHEVTLLGEQLNAETTKLADLEAALHQFEAQVSFLAALVDMKPQERLYFVKGTIKQLEDELERKSFTMVEKKNHLSILNQAVRQKQQLLSQIAEFQAQIESMERILIDVQGQSNDD